MDVERLRELLEKVKAGETPIDDALSSLRSLPFEDLGFAKLDHHRALRNGFPEVIYCPGKTTEHIVTIAEKLAARSPKVLASRATPEVAEAVQAALPKAVYHKLARMIVIPGFGADASPSPPTPLPQGRGETERKFVQEHGMPTNSIPEEKLSPSLPSPLQGEGPGMRGETRRVGGTVLVCAAGTADLPIAEEAFVTVSEMGSPTERLYDVGVAGIHRLFSHQDQLFAANVLIVVAGMEGALPSVIGGLVSRPVIAVPTSVGYGANFNGLSALLTMLNSCASGIGVVNIDNGFGAGYLAHLINQSVESGR